MSVVSTIKSYDLAMRALLTSRYATLLSFSDLGATEVQQMNNGVIFYPKDVALRQISEKRGKDYLSTPFINIWRASTEFSWNRNRTVLSRGGLVVQKTDGTYVPVSIVPMDLTYNFWVWTLDMDLATQVASDYALWQQQYPRLEITFNGEYILNPEFHLAEITDESTVEQMFTVGKYFVYKFPMKLEAWIIDESATPAGIANKIQLTVYYKDEVINYPEIYLENSLQNVQAANVLKLDRISQYLISGLDATNKIIVTPDDRTIDFSVGTKLLVDGSTLNSNIYTVGEPGSIYSEADNETWIYVDKDIDDTEVDGYLVKVE